MIAPAEFLTVSTLPFWLNVADPEATVGALGLASAPDEAKHAATAVASALRCNFARSSERIDCLVFPRLVKRAPLSRRLTAKPMPEIPAPGLLAIYYLTRRIFLNYRNLQVNFVASVLQSTGVIANNDGAPVLDDENMTQSL
jgi:hypothetical protein